MTCVFGTSLEVEVDVLSEETLTGVRQLTSHAFLTFVSVDGDGSRLPVAAAARSETDAERRQCEDAQARRAERLKKRKAEGSDLTMHNAQRAHAGCRMPDVECAMYRKASLRQEAVSLSRGVSRMQAVHEPSRQAARPASDIRRPTPGIG